MEEDNRGFINEESHPDKPIGDYIDAPVDTKYYIPELEEFHIGFEYEYSTHAKHGIWNKHILTESILGNINYGDSELFNPFSGDWTQENFRVKYLDKEDIESLGFKLIGQKHFQNLTDDSKYIIKESINHISVYEFQNGNLNRDEGMPIIFNMSCKNKSKLKSILKDVGVL